MTKTDVYEIIKPLVEQAYADGKNGESYAKSPSRDEYAKWYRREFGQEPAAWALEFFEFAIRVIYEANARAYRRYHHEQNL